MIRHRRAYAALATVTAIAAAHAAPAGAGFTVSSAAAPSFSITLNGLDHAGAYTVPLTVDNSAVGASLTGWHLTITSTQFTGGGRTLPTSASTVTGVSAVCATICTSNPTNTVTYSLGVPAGSTPPAAVTFFNAATATGIGTFTVTPTIAVTVPANAYAGAYSSTLTIAIASGP